MSDGSVTAFYSKDDKLMVMMPLDLLIPMLSTPSITRLVQNTGSDAYSGSEIIRAFVSFCEAKNAEMFGTLSGGQ